MPSRGVFLTTLWILGNIGGSHELESRGLYTNRNVNLAMFQDTHTPMSIQEFRAMV
jgi:hypothetical protein